MIRTREAIVRVTLAFSPDGTIMPALVCRKDGRQPEHMYLSQDQLDAMGTDIIGHWTAVRIADKWSLNERIKTEGANVGTAD